MSRNVPIEKRFWSKVKKVDGCWEWIGVKARNGYGLFTVSGRRLGAHRVVYTLIRGEIPEGFCVLHQCDNPGCVNPEHLFLGTNADNVADRNAKGRTARGRDTVPPEKRARGERHGRNTKPERSARGERHGSRTHPERFGWNQYTGPAPDITMFEGENDGCIRKQGHHHGEAWS
jgi:hypothetical protein